MTEQLHEEEAYEPKTEQVSLYGEEQMMHDYSTMSTEALEDKAQRFIEMLNNPTTLPNHRKIAARLLDMVVFEVTYRDVTADGNTDDHTTEAL